MSLYKFLFFYLTLLNSIVQSKNLFNVVFILTDDQDVMLGGVTPLTKTREIFKNGAEATNMFVTTPLCCPSRASFLTGKYMHNHKVVNNSLNGNCNSVNWQNIFENETFITHVQRAGYNTFYAGKYLNQYGHPDAGGIQHIPPGWNEWIGLVGNSVYYNYSLSVNGHEEYHGDNPSEDYLTDVLFKKSTEFLDSQSNDTPFFMMVSPPAPHSPFTAAPQYEKMFSNVSAPRTPNFGLAATIRKHWLLQQPPDPLPKDVLSKIDDIYRKRWQTLLSVDDGVEKIYNKLKEKNLLNNTWIIFTSDNGFHFGQFSLPPEKRQPYEFDIRVPLFILGYGVKPGLFEMPVLNIDFAPSFLTLSGIETNDLNMDGTSFVHLLTQSRQRYNFDGRTFLVEYNGEVSSGPVPSCPQYKPYEVRECSIDCICADSWNNTYRCIRKIDPNINSLSCVFLENEDFFEIYNITADPYQMNNVGITSSNTKLIQNLKSMMHCHGKSCIKAELFYY